MYTENRNNVLSLVDIRLLVNTLKTMNEPNKISPGK